MNINESLYMYFLRDFEWCGKFTAKLENVRILEKYMNILEEYMNILEEYMNILGESTM
jgi:hypothetical protein